jgi:ribosome-associated protein
MSKKNREVFAEEEPLAPSKSELKREMHSLQKLGESIVKLSKGDLATIPLDPQLEEAITVARRIKSREGLRRQMQYIGKLMRTTDIEAIQQSMLALEDGRRQQADKFHQLEQWRDQLVEQGPNSIEQITEKYPHADRQHLRQLIVQAHKEKATNKPPASSRKLFRYLKELGTLEQ